MPTILGQALSGNGADLDQVEGSAIRDVWYGRRPLGEVYWKYGFIGGLTVNAAGFGFGALAAMMHSKVPIILYLVLLIPYQVWITVGLWRAARNDGGFWGLVVRVLVVLGVIYTPFSIADLFHKLSRIG